MPSTYRLAIVARCPESLSVEQSREESIAGCWGYPNVHQGTLRSPLRTLGLANPSECPHAMRRSATSRLLIESTDIDGLDAPIQDLTARRESPFNVPWLNRRPGIAQR